MEAKDLEVFAEIADQARAKRLLKQGLKAIEEGNSTKLGQSMVKLKDLDLMSDRLISQETDEWVAATKGYFSVTSCYGALHLVTKRQKTACRVHLHRQVQAEVIERHATKNGLYRKVEKEVEIMNLKDAETTPLVIDWPLGIGEYYVAYCKNIHVFAGTKDSGKTAFFLDFIKRNQKYGYEFRYLNSEMSPEELRMRMDKHTDMKFKDWKFTPIERMSNFADIIKPDAINIIDYIEVNKNFSEVADEIKDIHGKLSNGIALIAIQKKYGEILGRGGDFTLQRPRLYVTFEHRPTKKEGHAKCFVAKNRRDPERGLAGRECTYKLWDAWKFKVTVPWMMMDEDPYEEREKRERK
jgi:hypothetical protein